MARAKTANAVVAVVHWPPPSVSGDELIRRRMEGLCIVCGYSRPAENSDTRLPNLKCEGCITAQRRADAAVRKATKKPYPKKA